MGQTDHLVRLDYQDQLAQQANRVMPEFPEHKDREEILDQQEIQVLLDHLGQMVQWELMDYLEMPVLLEILVSKGRQANKV